MELTVRKRRRLGEIANEVDSARAHQAFGQDTLCNSQWMPRWPEKALGTYACMHLQGMRTPEYRRPIASQILRIVLT